jgi:hypothetical protein
MAEKLYQEFNSSVNVLFVMKTTDDPIISKAMRKGFWKLINV